MRKIKILAAILSFFFIQALCMAGPNASDANSFRGRSPRTRGMYRSERVVINWHDGVQQMLVSPRLTPDTNSLWLFPLKCKSEQVKFSLAKNFPQLYGTDSREIAGNALTNVNYTVIASQLWTIPFCYYWAERIRLYLWFRHVERRRLKRCAYWTSHGRLGAGTDAAA